MNNSKMKTEKKSVETLSNCWGPSDSFEYSHWGELFKMSFP